MSKQEKKCLVPELRFPEFREAGEWERKQLSELLFEPKQRNRKLEYGPQDVLSVSGVYGCVNQIEFMGRSYAGVTVKDYHVVKTGDIVYTKSPLKKNPFGIIKENKGKPGIVSTLYAVYRVTDMAYPAYLDHYFSRNFNLNSYLQPIVNKGAKNDMKVNNSDVLSGKIPAPKTEEQQKIADCLTSVDELIAALTQKLDALKTHKKGLMQQLFPAEGETVPKRRFPEFRDKGEWATACLGVIASIKSGSTPLRSNSKFHDGGDIPWVKTTDLNNSFICSTEECITSLSNPRINPEETVLVAMYGGFNQIGRTGFLKIPAATNQALSALNTDRSKVQPIYLLMWLNAKVEDWKRIASSSRKDPNITGSDVADFPIKFPCVEEQQKIADCLTSIDEMITNQTQKIEALKTHKKGLMQQLFPVMEEVSA